MGFSTEDTIVAVATPHGRGGLGVVRLSGPDAHRIVLLLLARSTSLQPRHATFGHIVTEDTTSDEPRRVDQVVVTWFETPRSFTGEDVVEISAHGSPVVLQQIVGLAMRRGARLAAPGEFTFRAHLNGRLDLVQAEAVADLIDAVTPLQARAAMDQLEGTLTSAIGAIDAALFDLSARLEASLDFPDEGFHFITRDQARGDLGGVRDTLAALLQDGRAGRVIRVGRLVVIAGRPNAGKSSLFNAFVGTARAIVTDEPGTTRDLLTERVDVGGIPITLVDTAGLRDTEHAIESEGVKRAREAQRIAALTLSVIDRSQPMTSEDAALAEGALAHGGLLAVSKSDLPAAWPLSSLGSAAERAVEVSVFAGDGLDELRRRVVSALTAREDWRDPPAVSNARHLALLETAFDAVERAGAALAAGATEELVLAELVAARVALEEVTGRRTPEDVLRHIFSRFCVGK